MSTKLTKKQVLKKANEARLVNKRKRQEEYLQKLEECRGNRSAAAAACGVGQTVVYMWEYESEAFAERVALARVKGRQIANDAVEDVLMRMCLAGDVTALIFYAKTQMKDRGYEERRRLDVNATNLEIKVNFTDFDDEIEETPEECEEL